MRKLKITKLNNQGSTFVMALIIITLLTTLAVAILAAAATNIAMKGVDRNSKATFYTAESVMDEIRAGVGLDSMNQLGVAYETVLKGIIKEDVLGYSYIVDNDTANKQFKAIFVENMLNRISNGQMEFISGKEEFLSIDVNKKEYVKQYLQGFIKGYDEGMASITSIGDVEAYKDSTSGLTYMLIIRDVAVSYKEQKAGETYFSNVTADLELSFPNMTVNFSTSNSLNDFVNYAIIADDNLKIDGKTVNVQSSIYAGGMINIVSNTMGGGHLNLSTGSTLDGQPANIVCGGNNDGDAGTIALMGTTDIKASLTATNVNIWCTNLVTMPTTIGSTDKSAGCNITIDDFCKTFVKDDLTLEGQDSEIEINGEYYGYSYDGYDVNALHANSSAIIINGKRAKLTLGTSRMILGGHAYIEVGDDYYTTGESLAFKGDQEIYLVPSEYLGKNFGTPVSNPMPESTWENLKAAAAVADSEVEICDVDGFFAEEAGYLSAMPYTVKKVEDRIYLYLNFTDKDAAAKYVKDVANGTNGAPASLKQLLNQYTASLFGDTGKAIINSEGGQIFTKGALLTTSGGSTGIKDSTSSSVLDNWVGANTNASLGNDEFVLTSLDLKNRYTIFTHLLASMPWTDSYTGKKYIVNDVDSALWQNKNYVVNGNELTTTSIFDTIIDRGLLASQEYNPTGAYIQYPEGTNYIKIAVNGNFSVPTVCNGGVIVATGDVEVKGDFEGLIIAGGDIIITNDATIKTNAAFVEELITVEIGFRDTDEEAEVAFREYFNAYKHAASEDGSREEVKVETVDYKDIVNFNNWRKYED